jgi:CRP-like cAMP-binding protein
MQSNLSSLLIPSLELETQSFGRRSLLPLRQSTLWKIETGVVRTITWLEDGTVVTLGLWGTEDIVGRSLSTMEPYQIECLTPVKAIPISLGSWLPDLTLLLAHIQQSETFLLIRGHKRVEDMLLKLLAWLSKRFGREVEQGHLIELRLTHQDLAELLGTTRVTITRVLSQFEQQGIVERLPQHLTLLKSTEVWHYEI